METEGRMAARVSKNSPTSRSHDEVTRDPGAFQWRSSPILWCSRCRFCFNDGERKRWTHERAWRPAHRCGRRLSRDRGLLARGFRARQRELARDDTGRVRAPRRRWYPAGRGGRQRRVHSTVPRGILPQGRHARSGAALLRIHPQCPGRLVDGVRRGPVAYRASARLTERCCHTVRHSRAK